MASERFRVFAFGILKLANVQFVDFFSEGDNSNIVPQLLLAKRHQNVTVVMTPEFTAQEQKLCYASHHERLAVVFLQPNSGFRFMTLVKRRFFDSLC